MGTYTRHHGVNENADVAELLNGDRGPALEPDRLHAETRRSSAQQRALAEVCQLALRDADHEHLLAKTASIIMEAMNAGGVGIFELSEDQRILRLTGSAGMPVDRLDLSALPVAVCRPLRQALSSGEIVSFPCKELSFLPFGADPEGSGLALAIGDRSNRSGVLTILSADPVNGLEAAETSFLQTITFIIAAVWDRRRNDTALMMRTKALEALDQGIMITDAQRLDNPLIYVNPAFERLSGYSAREVLGKNPRFLQGKETGKSQLQSLRSAVETGNSFRDTLINYRKDGEPFWNDLTISTVRDDKGAAVQHVGVLSDVSERVRLEAQLRQAQKMEAIGHLTGGIAHDFNNLLAVIMGNIEILLDDIPDQETRETLQLMMETAERGALLTQRLLSFGRRQVLHPEPLDISSIIDSVTQMLQRTLGEHICLKTEHDGSTRLAQADRSMLESAIVNLAVNARDAMPDGGELTITSSAIDQDENKKRVAQLQPGEYVRLAVSDTGTGMTEEVMNQVFEPFFTTKGVGAGSGLGLAMVYGFTKQSGGHVTIESEVGEGTTVNLFLPKATQDQTRIIAANSGDNPIPTGSERILLVEDEIEVRRFVKRLLNRLGYSVLEAEDALTAINVLETTNKIDLMFSDLILPAGINGLRLMERARDIRPDLRVLLTTGYTEEYERLAATSPAQILRKPYKRRELAVMLRSVLDSTSKAA